MLPVNYLVPKNRRNLNTGHWNTKSFDLSCTISARLGFYNLKMNFENSYQNQQFLLLLQAFDFFRALRLSILLGLPSDAINEQFPPFS